MTSSRLNDARILMYSHDTFGLGHLRRCRTIAHALVERFKGLNVLIISGSQIAGHFDFRARVDFVKIPSVIKLYSGDYTSVSEHIDIHDTLEMRETSIRDTARRFAPDIMIVDKEPMGLKGEMEATLRELRKGSCKTVLGLRDVMDSPELLAREWAEKDALSKIEELYDAVWIYGPQDFFDPLEGMNVSDTLRGRISHTGFLRREQPETPHFERYDLPENYLLVTAGGGGDGLDIMNWVLAAREHDRDNTFPLVLVPGPFMKTDPRHALHQRAQDLANVHVIDFDAELEVTIKGCTALVGMCGYNTFCEVLSFDKPALFVPRTHPREEQLIRAQRAQALELTAMLDSDQACVPARMARALRELASSPPPSASNRNIDLDGLTAIGDRVFDLLNSEADARP